ncbi:MAG TPA: hypothetical protein VGO91_15205 [Pyrinomonadaceae bacterium]|nr:hypothetical protein [Pyrinomonadaceae bacterium]
MKPLLTGKDGLERYLMKALKSRSKSIFSEAGRLVINPFAMRLDQNYGERSSGPIDGPIDGPILVIFQ